MPMPQPQLSYQWLRTSDPDSVALMLNGMQIGGYRYSTRRYYRCENGPWTWSTIPEGAPPFPAPVFDDPLARQNQMQRRPLQAPRLSQAPRGEEP